MTRTVVAAAGRCRDCRFFLGEAAALERSIRGLSILSSAYGAVRGETGLCRLRDEFVTASGSCGAFERRDSRGSAEHPHRRIVGR